MRPNDMLLRCYAARDGDLWVAVCLDLSLGAQGASLPEAKEKLEQQIKEYVVDALVGEDRQHAAILLKRRAPASEWATYYWARLCIAVQRVFRTSRLTGAKPFREVLPLTPVSC